MNTSNSIKEYDTADKHRNIRNADKGTMQEDNEDIVPNNNRRRDSVEWNIGTQQGEQSRRTD